MNFRSEFREAIAPEIRDAVGDTATIIPVSGGSSVSVTGKFDETGVVQPNLTELGISSAQLTFEYLSTDYPEPSQGDRMEIDGRDFEVLDYEPDQIWTRLQLKAL